MALLHVLLILVGVLIIENETKKCDLGYHCSCSEDYELINCVDAGIYNMTLIKFIERLYENAKIINLKQNMINEIERDVIVKFVNLQIINLKDKDSNLCFLKPEFNISKTLILNDCGMDNITGDAVTTTQTILETEPGILKQI